MILVLDECAISMSVKITATFTFSKKVLEKLPQVSHANRPALNMYVNILSFPGTELLLTLGKCLLPTESNQSLFSKSFDNLCYPVKFCYLPKQLVAEFDSEKCYL